MCILNALCCAAPVHADPPGLTYLFPAGGQRGAAVAVRVGGLCLHDRCGFTVLGPGVDADRELKRTNTIFFEGPLLPLPDSQRTENYPQDLLGQVRITADAPLGKRNALAWTAEGGCSGPVFVVGDLPEIIEAESPGARAAAPVRLPVTINGRIFPREDVDDWSFTVAAGAVVTAEALAEKIGTPLQVRLEVVDSLGRRLTESAARAGHADARVRFTAPAAGTYRIRVFDARYWGGPEFVYRLTITAGPHIDSVYPLGGRRGATTEFELLGANLPAGRQSVALPAAPGAEWHHVFAGAGQSTLPFCLELDDLPERLETEPNDVVGGSSGLNTPFVANGRIKQPGDVDVWPVHLHKGKAYEFDLRARRLDSPLQAVLTLVDGHGKELVRVDPLEQNAVDPKITFTAAADGVYWLRVVDRFRSRGGSDFTYRLRVHATAQTTADFRVIAKPDVIAIERGKTANIKVECQRLGGFTGPIEVRAAGLPTGVTVKPVTIGPMDKVGELHFVASTEALLSGTLIRLESVAEVAGKRMAKAAVVAPANHQALGEQLLLVVATKAPFVLKSDYLFAQAPRGTTFRKRYRIDRNGYSGSLEIRLADRQARHLQGVTGPTITIPPEVNEFEYPITMPPWMETGRTCRVCVMSTGRIRDRDGTEHSVSYSSVEQHMQVIVVVEPGRLGVELERSSLAVTAGGTQALAVKVARGAGLKGQVKVELVGCEHWHGLQVEPLLIASERTAGIITLRFAKEVRGPFALPLLIRATLLEGDNPVVAEAKLDLVAP